MKKLALIVLIMTLGLSGCESSGMTGLIIDDWSNFLKPPGGGSREVIKEDFVEFWHDIGHGSWEAVKMDWAELLN